MTSHSPSQRYLSTRGGSYNFSFEEVVLKGLAEDGGLFIPEEIPSLPSDWAHRWRDLSFAELALEIFSLYIADEEIPREDLGEIVRRSYSTFRDPSVTPLITLDRGSNLYLLELFHGPTFAFKDVALQLLGNLFEYFLARRNRDRADGQRRHHLTVIGATSGDTGSAAIYGLRGKKDVSVFIFYPKGKVSPVQEAQMTTVPDPNVHTIAVEGTFDDCQVGDTLDGASYLVHGRHLLIEDELTWADVGSSLTQDYVKALFADSTVNQTHHLAAVNSINWARILAQISYYYHAYFSLLRSTTYSNSSSLRFAVPTGNFGDVLAGYFAKRMGLPVTKLIVATNANDILHRFWETGRYEKQAVSAATGSGGLVDDGAKAHPDGVRETLSPAMDILVSSNFERLLWYLAYETGGGSDDVGVARARAGAMVKGWLADLTTRGGFGVDSTVLDRARRDFESDRVTDEQTVETIRSIFASTSTPSWPIGYVLDPHSAVGVRAAVGSIGRHGGPETYHVALATAHPAKFAHAVELALTDAAGFSFADLMPEALVGLEAKESRRRLLPKADAWTHLVAMLNEGDATTSASV